MASPQPNNFNFPFFPPPPFQPFHPPPPPSHSFTPPPPQPHEHPPPPPFHPIAPPPPHVQPTPAPIPPSPTPNHPIVIVVVVVSLGGLLFLSLLAFALFSFIKRRKKRTSQETNIIHIDEHKKVKEEIVSDPFGQQAMVISVEDDVRTDGEIKKGHALHAKSSSADEQVNSTSQDVGNTSGFEHHHPELQHKPISHD